jgi:hypothetical protein
VRSRQGNILSTWINLARIGIIAGLAVSLSAQDSGGAILRSDGGVALNRNPAPPSSAIFPDDLIQTQSQAQATINASKSTATVGPDTIVQFEGNVLNLDHGTLLVNTSNGMTVRVGCISITPVNIEEWTQYDVTDTDGKVTVNAYKNDVNIDDAGAKSQQNKSLGHSQRVSVKEGNRASREEKCAAALKPSGYVPAKIAILNSSWAKWAGVGAIAALCIEICTGTQPLSPYRP